MLKDTNCPRCDEEIQVEIETLEDKSQEIECENCGATLEISYTVSVEVDADISEVPAAEFVCPEDDNSMSIDDIEQEIGSQEVTCDACGAVLEVSWSNWGRDDVDVQVTQEGEKDEEDDDDENGVEGELDHEEEDDDEDEIDNGDEDEEDEDEEDEEW
jgi:ribosomal protein S27E